MYIFKNDHTPKSILNINSIKLLFLSCMLFVVQFTYSQENETYEADEDEIINNLISIDDSELLDLIKELNKYQILLVSVDYSNKTYFLGRDLGIDQYSLNSQMMYQSYKGFYAGISGNFYSEFDPKWDLTVLTAGYGKDFGKNENLRLEMGFSRYLFSDTESKDFENSVDASFYFSNVNKTLGTALSSSYLFGERTGFQSNIAIFGDVKLFDLEKLKGYKLTFGPELSFLFASENIDTSRFDELGIDFPFINRIVDSFEAFKLRNVQLQIPLVFEFNNFQLEAGYNINFPSKFEFENSVDTTSFFNIGLSYLFNIK